MAVTWGTQGKKGAKYRVRNLDRQVAIVAAPSGDEIPENPAPLSTKPVDNCVDEGEPPWFVRLSHKALIDLVNI
jgi:hypothetical protein